MHQSKKKIIKVECRAGEKWVKGEGENKKKKTKGWRELEKRRKSSRKKGSPAKGVTSPSPPIKRKRVDRATRGKKHGTRLRGGEGPSGRMKRIGTICNNVPKYRGGGGTLKRKSDLLGSKGRRGKA